MPAKGSSNTYPQTTSFGVSNIQLLCNKDDVRTEEVLRVLARLDNSRCNIPIKRIQIGLTRFIKYRLEFQAGGQECIQKTKLLNKRYPGVP